MFTLKELCRVVPYVTERDPISRVERIKQCWRVEDDPLSCDLLQNWYDKDYKDDDLEEQERLKKKTENLVRKDNKKFTANFVYEPAKTDANIAPGYFRKMCYSPQCMPICYPTPMPCPTSGAAYFSEPSNGYQTGSAQTRSNGVNPEPGEVAAKFSVVGGEVHRICKCTRRNGLQDDCPMPGCRGNPECLNIPLPTCEPAGYYKTESNKYSLQCCYDPRSFPEYNTSNMGNCQYIPCPYL